ncbi:urease accessory protein UreD [Roseococcus sp. SDR]|uniref:urease accessory protein UreD n=1 Tax=Roseococcus sp. SDR TaxID=2835532 RepID=UPI001BCFCF92|nr:urease accessory protein UreD [Roseococcus sp. SDR]MBS7790681.1 urease accessory protein UreD [Roseococcus sp. SDR]MBV1845995.1 urease accessory protein UreD [Roseococcus sp. SDR]
MIRHQRAIGAASLDVAAHGLVRLAQASPLRILFPTPEPGAALEAAFVNVAGGLAGGDSITSGITLLPGARAQITTPAAEKIYRSLGDASAITTRIEVAEGAVLEFLPQEAILFDGAVLTRAMDARVAPGGTLLAAEAVVLGRIARGEVWHHGALHDRWRLSQGERLIWADAMRLDAARRDAPFGLDGADSLGMILLLAEDAARHRELARDLTDGAASLVRPGLLLLRFLGTAGAVRGAMAAAIPALRAAALGLPPVLPRLWTC